MSLMKEFINRLSNKEKIEIEIILENALRGELLKGLETYSKSKIWTKIAAQLMKAADNDKNKAKQLARNFYNLVIKEIESVSD